MVAFYAAAPLIHPEHYLVFALMTPIILATSSLGAMLYGRFGEIGFRRIVLIILLLSGVPLVMPALAGLLPRN